MILFHGTNRDALPSILLEGLTARGWCVYLSPLPEVARGFGQGVLLVVDLPDEVPLTAFDQETAEWELLCWQDIPPERIKVLENGEEAKLAQ